MALGTKIAILGAGQIGRAIFQILRKLKFNVLHTAFTDIDIIIFDSNADNLLNIDATINNSDLSTLKITEISAILKKEKVTHVMNALPFHMNEKVASAAKLAKCAYIDFTEDDIMAESVMEIYKDSGLTCAVKCGLAPGFINYVGHELVKLIDEPDSLTISVGALPRTVSYDKKHPEHSYNLTWSVDGLVNEYLRDCKVRKDGKEILVNPLSEKIKIILDGVKYEAAHTSGGIGSLVRDLVNVPNVCYKTLRYPGHYKYVQSILAENDWNFEKIKKIFIEKFPFTDDDVIIVYANVLGKNKGIYSRRTYHNKFYGVNGLTAIQSTTAGSGVAILELMLTNKISGLITHSSIDFQTFTNTLAFREYYKSS